jgi:hypothetical protein
VTGPRGESLRSSDRLVSLRGPVRADEAASHAVKRIAVAARQGRRDRKRRRTLAAAALLPLPTKYVAPQRHHR